MVRFIAKRRLTITAATQVEKEKQKYKGIIPSTNSIGDGLGQNLDLQIFRELRYLSISRFKP